MTEHVYIIDFVGVIKVGYSSKPRIRINTVATSSGREISRWWISPPVKDARKLEGSLHKSLDIWRTTGEFFTASFDDAVKLAEKVSAGCIETPEDAVKKAQQKEEKAEKVLENMQKVLGWGRKERRFRGASGNSYCSDTSHVQMSSIALAELLQVSGDQLEDTILELVQEGFMDVPDVANEGEKEVYLIYERDSHSLAERLAPGLLNTLSDHWKKDAQEIPEQLGDRFPRNQWEMAKVREDPRLLAAYLAPLAMSLARGAGLAGNKARLAADDFVRSLTGVSVLELLGQTSILNSKGAANA